MGEGEWGWVGVNGDEWGVVTHCSITLTILLLLTLITITILQQRIFKTRIYLMTILSSELFLNSLSQFARLCGLEVVTRDL